MNVLEKILEEIEEATFQEDAPIYIGNMEVDGYVRASRVKDIIRSHMNEKEKVTSAEIISRKTDGKPYYGIKYKKVGEDHYTVGYSSYYLDYVIDWLNNCFEFCGESKIVVNVGKDTNVPIPIAKGGHPSDINNLQLAHWTCNRQKSDKLIKRRDKEKDEVISNRVLPHTFDWKNIRRSK